MDPDDGLDDDGPVLGWLPPDDRLWRHPSEVGSPQHASDRTAPAGRTGRPGDGRVVGIAVLAGLTGALLTIGFGVVAGGLPRATTVVRPIERVSDTTDAIARTFNASRAGDPTADVIGIAERLRPTIVQIQVDGDNGKGTGSGVIFRSDGQIITNHHVVDGARSVVAILDDGSRVKARIVGADPETDIAVIKIEGPARAVATLGTTAGLKVGQLAVAIGSPLGLAGGPSVTTGIVSALGRTVTVTDGPPLLDMIQTDAPIAPGSSGGALVDHLGDVIGITSAAASSDAVRGLGFAIPVDVARDVAEQLIGTGHVTHVWLGVEGEDLDAAMANLMGVDGGALVKTVVGASPAARAGISISDVITTVEGRPVKGMGDLLVALRSRHVGDKVAVGLLHAGVFRTVVAVLAERPASPA